MPASAKSSTCIRQTASTVPAEAPRHRSVAIVRARDFEPGANPIRHPDAADQQRGQAHQGHEQCDLIDEAGQAGGGIARLADAPSVIGKRRLQRRRDSRPIAARRQREAHRVLQQRARYREPRRRQGIQGDQHPGAENARIDHTVGLVGLRPADDEARIAQPHRFAGMQPEAVEHDPLGEQPRRAGPPGQRGAKRLRRRYGRRPQQRPGGIDCLQRHQLAARRTGRPALPAS